MRRHGDTITKKNHHHSDLFSEPVYNTTADDRQIRESGGQPLGPYDALDLKQQANAAI